MTMMTKTILSAITFITISEQQTTHRERGRSSGAEQSRAAGESRTEQNKEKQRRVAEKERGRIDRSGQHEGGLPDY
jgi:hypothetical protein